MKEYIKPIAEIISLNIKENITTDVWYDEETGMTEYDLWAMGSSEM